MDFERKVFRDLLNTHDGLDGCSFKLYIWGNGFIDFCKHRV